MPIIPKVGRKSPGIRILLGAIYLILTLGAVTMVYPFLLMLSTSIAGATDYNEFRVLPRYVLDNNALFSKVVDEKYAGDIDLINAIYHTEFAKSDKIVLPPSKSIAENDSLVKLWKKFLPSIDVQFRTVGYRDNGTHPGKAVTLYRNHLRERFHDDILLLNKEFTEENENFERVSMPQERPNRRSWAPDNSPKMVDFVHWKGALPYDMRPVYCVDALFGKYLREEAGYGGDLKKVSAVWGVAKGFGDFVLPSSAFAIDPSHPKRLTDWETFVRTKLPFRYIIVAVDATNNYVDFLQKKYSSITKFNSKYLSSLHSFAEISLPKSIPSEGSLNVDWGEFLKQVPLKDIVVVTPDSQFRSYAQKNGIASILGQPIHIPSYYVDSQAVISDSANLRRFYFGRNYSIVLGYILLHGRSLVVTAIYCLLVVLVTLIVNPLCAYALSRYSLPYAHSVLIFVLATMAFPAEVAMIPNFLLLKQLGLLNTFWALVLPGAANGFSIFLLKGFFDSLPKELYEAGTLDGASETRMFFNLTIPLSKPIFAVIALQAFTGAYGAFMFALVVCQNPRMWTLMVWLYELQSDHPIYIMMAGLAVAAIPTLMIFVFAQNIIMRGIILPQEK